MSECKLFHLHAFTVTAREAPRPTVESLTAGTIRQLLVENRSHRYH